MSRVNPRRPLLGHWRSFPPPMLSVPVSSFPPLWSMLPLISSRSLIAPAAYLPRRPAPGTIGEERGRSARQMSCQNVAQAQSAVLRLLHYISFQTIASHFAHSQCKQAGSSISPHTCKGSNVREKKKKKSSTAWQRLIEHVCKKSGSI